MRKLDHDINGKKLAVGTYVIMYALIGNEGSDIVGCGQIKSMEPMHGGEGPMVWVEGYACHHPWACVAIYPYHATIIMDFLNRKKKIKNNKDPVEFAEKLPPQTIMKAN